MTWRFCLGMFAFLGGLLLFATPKVLAQPRPVPTFKGTVVDEVGLLRSGEAQAIAQRLFQLKNAQSISMAVVIAQSLGQETLESFSMRVVEAWKLGDRKSDRGILFVLVPQARKLRLEIGYGLEGVIPDLMSKRILDEEAVPAFREQEYGTGILRTIDRISAIVGQEPGSQPMVRPQIPLGKRRFPITLVLAVFWIVIIVLSRRVRPGRGVWTSSRSWRHQAPEGWGGGFSRGGGFLGGGGFSGGGRFGGGGASSSW